MNRAEGLPPIATRAERARTAHTLRAMWSEEAARRMHSGDTLGYFAACNNAIRAREIEDFYSTPPNGDQ